MLCAYIDDSGNTGARLNDPEQPFHYVGAIIVPEIAWMGLKTSLTRVAKDALGTVPDSFEFHGSELYRGKGVWKHTSLADRMDIYRECLSLLNVYDIDIVYGRCDKKLMQRYTRPFHPHYIAFWLCLEGIAKYMAARDELGFIVADDSEEGTRKVARKVLRDYRKKAPFGMAVDVSRVIDTVHFMSSIESPHIQLCDLALFVIRRKQVFNDDRYGLAELVMRRIRDGRTFPY